MYSKGYGGGYSQNQESMTVKIANELKALPKPLSEILTTVDVYLPEGKAHRIANDLRNTTSNQVRKIFSMVKEAEALGKKDFNKGREKLFMIVPISAYAVGRKLIDQDFYKLLEVCINMTKIKTGKDIEMFSKFFESIVAYLKK